MDQTEPNKFKGGYFLAILFLFLGLVAFLSFINIEKLMYEKANLTQLVESLEKNELKELVVRGQEAKWERKDGKKFVTIIPPDSSIVDRAVNNKVAVTIQEPSNDGLWLAIILNGLLPVLLIVGLFYFFAKQVQIGAGKGFNFGKARTRLVSGGSKRVTFRDVAGVDEAKEELQEIIEFLKDPKKFSRLSDSWGGKCAFFQYLG